MGEAEEVLSERADRKVVRVGDTVRHPRHPWSAAVAELLQHLHRRGFDAAPRYRGIDDQGRDVVDYLPGESGAAGWHRVVGERGLRNLAVLLRDYHEAVRGFRPSASLAPAPPVPESDELLVCHGDVGPWNVVWNGDRPVGLLDWEYAVLAPTRFDLGYALDYAVPFRDDATTLRWHHFPALPDRARRARVFLAAYGADDADPAELMITAQRFQLARIELLAERGHQRQCEWIASGQLDADRALLAWRDRHRRLVTP